MDSVRLFLQRVGRLSLVLRKNERRLIGVLLFVIVCSSVAIVFGNGGTKPAYGGTYSEGFVGAPRFINPLFATSSTDTAITKMIYSGLTKQDASGRLQPDLATSWDVQPDGKRYTFHLRSDIVWHDGSHFSSDDVVFTIKTIQDATLQSPLLDFWKDITVSAPDKNTVVFDLKDPRAYFLWNTTIGIVPAHIGKANITGNLIGTGPYKYSKIRTVAGKAETLILVRNNNWYADHLPYIDTIECWFYDDQSQASDAINHQKIQALVSTDQLDPKRLNQYTMNLTQKTVLILNTQSAALAGVDARKSLLDPNKPLTLAKPLVIYADSRYQSEPAFQQFLASLKKRSIPYTLTAVSIDDIKSVVIPSHAYDAVLLSIDTGPQTDQYAYWHSSQIDTGLNVARVKNPDLDKLVTSQRVTTDLVARMQTLTQIQQFVVDQAIELPVADHLVQYDVSKSVHVIAVQKGSDASDRFNTIDQWYIKTRR